jgi:hypothetical protein
VYMNLISVLILVNLLYCGIVHIIKLDLKQSKFCGFVHKYNKPAPK